MGIGSRSPADRRKSAGRAWVGRVVMALILLGAAPMAGAAPSAAAATSMAASDYRIGVFDKLSVNVFGVKELALDAVQVDAAGQIQLPLVGAVHAAGKTSTELSHEIADKLNKDFTQNAQVSVTVASSANQKVTVEGAVTDPGVFDIPGRMTLLQAIAMAKGPTNRADITAVAIFRVVDGAKTRLTYNVTDIREGKADDPEMKGNDLVVVSESKKLSAMRELIGNIGVFSIIPLLLRP